MAVPKSYYALGAGGFGIFMPTSSVIGILEDECSKKSSIEFMIEYFHEKNTSLSYSENMTIREKNQKGQSDQNYPPIGLQPMSEGNAHENISELTKLLKTMENKKGFKLLAQRNHYDMEVVGLMSTVCKIHEGTNGNYFGKPGTPDKQGDFIGFSVRSSTEFNFQMRTKRGNIEDVSQYGLYFVCMDIMEPIESYFDANFPKPPMRSVNYVDDIKRYNVFVLEKVLQPLIEELQKYHAMGMYHKDIKTDNIMFNPNSGKATFIDFGLMSNELDNFYCGTYYYMSPWYAHCGKFYSNAINVESSTDDMNPQTIWKDLRQTQTFKRFKSFDYESFPLAYASHSYIANRQAVVKQIKTIVENLKKKETDERKKNDINETKLYAHFLLQKNDYYCLGMSIQEICDMILPSVDSQGTYDSFLHKYSRTKFELKTRIATTIDAFGQGQKDNFVIAPPLTQKMCKCMSDFMYSKTVQIDPTCYKQDEQGGGRIQKKKGAIKKFVRKEYILGRERTVYKKRGEGQTLYITFFKKEVPLKAARKLDKRVEKLRKQNLI